MSALPDDWPAPSGQWPATASQHGPAIGPRIHDVDTTAIRIRPVAPVVDARPLRVLVADDNIAHRTLAELLLRQQGHDPLTVVDGREAVDALGCGSFDLVLMDLQMPEIDGFEATAAIRARERGTGSRTPIVALAPHGMQCDVQRCLDADMDGCVATPIDPGEFFAVIDAVSRAA